MPLQRASEAYATKWEVLVYGDPGVGKTTLFAACPRVLYIVVDDNGYIVLQDHANAGDIIVFHTRNWKELVAFINGLPKNSLMSEIDTIVVDTISECQTLERLSQIGGASMEDNWKFNQHIYTVNNFRIQAMVRIIKRTGKNVAWLCHVTKENVMGANNQIKEVIVRPALSATLMTAVQTGIDGQFYMRKTGPNRTLETDTSEVQTKSRFKKGRALSNPTWKDLEPLLTSRMKPKEQSNEP